MNNEIPKTQQSHTKPSGTKRRITAETKTKQNLDFKNSILFVSCGKAKGFLYMEKLAAGASEKCIKDSDGNLFTPREFEIEGGRESWNYWKRSIYYEGRPLKELMMKWELPNPPRKYHRKKKKGELPNQARKYNRKIKVLVPEQFHQAKYLSRPFRRSARFQLSDTTASAREGPSSAAGKRASQSQSVIESNSPDATSSSSTSDVVCNDSPEWAAHSPPQGSPSETAPVPSHLLNGSLCQQPLLILNRLPLAKATGASNNPSEPPQLDLQAVHGTSSWEPHLYATASAAEEGPSSAAGKRASQSQSVIESPFPDPTSSSSTSDVVCGDSPKWATPSPPQGSPSEVAPVSSHLLNGSPCQQPLLILNRLPLAKATGASNNPSEPPTSSWEPNLSSSLGFAILDGQHNIKQLFLDTLGKRRTVQVKLQDIQGHLDGLRKQQDCLLQALNDCSESQEILDVSKLEKQMEAIVSHQQVLQTLMQQILAILRLEETRP